MNAKRHETTPQRRPTARRISAFLLCLIGLGMATAQVGQATLIAADDFTYADGSVGGGEEAGGSGWSGAWGASGAIPEYVIESNQAIFKGNGNSTIITHSRSLASNVTIGIADTAVIAFDLIIGPSDGQIGRGVGMNFLDSATSNIVFTLGKRLNGEIGVYSSGIAGTSTLISDGTFARVAGTTYPLAATLTYNGVDTTLDLTDGNTTYSATFAGTQVSIGTVQLTGYHPSTTGNGVDNFSIDLTTIPEPASALLVLVGLGALGLHRRRHA